MHDTYRDTIYKDFYPLYGKFSIEFENMIDKVKTVIVMAIAGNDVKRQSIAYILIDKEGATGSIKKLRAMLPLIYEPESQERALCDKLLVQVKGIIQYRNNLIHSSWIFGPSERKGEEITVPYSFQRAQSEKKSYYVTFSEFDAEMLKEKTKMVSEAKRLLNSIAFSLRNEGIDIIKEFQNSKLF